MVMRRPNAGLVALEAEIKAWEVRGAAEAQRQREKELAESRCREEAARAASIAARAAERAALHAEAAQRQTREQRLLMAGDEGAVERVNAELRDYFWRRRHVAGRLPEDGG